VGVFDLLQSVEEVLELEVAEL